MAVNFTIERCNQATIKGSAGSSTVLDFKPINSTAQPNAAVMVFEKKKIGSEFSIEPGWLIMEKINHVYCV